MASAQNFRAAFNGFNRDDVVNYISLLNTKHENQLNELHQQILELQEQLDSRPEPNGESDALRLAQQEVEQLRAQLAAQAEQTPPLPETESSNPNIQEEELQAYRRAESAERRAMERVDQMFHQANGILAELSTRLQENTQQVNEIAEQVRADLEALEQATARSKELLDDSNAMMASIQVS